LVKLFDDKTKVIFQSPDPIGYEVVPNSRKWILLPLIAFKVLVPYPTDNPLNLFQETTLKLFRSGNKTPANIAERLIIHEELAEYVIKELIELELLTEEGLVTPKGNQLLDEQNDQYDMETGYVFYDVTNKMFWDSFIFDSEYQHVQSSFGTEKRRFEYGNIGNPRHGTAVVIKSDVAELPEDPSNTEILSIILRHKRKMRNLSRGGYQDQSTAVELPKNLQKVKFLGEKFPVFAATYLFMPKDIHNKSYWQVCHPFKGGVSHRLRESLEKQSHEDGFGYLKSEIDDLIHTTFRVSQLEMEGLAGEQNNEGYSFIKNVLSKKVDDYPNLLMKLISTYKLYKDLSKSKLSGKNYEKSQLMMSDFITNSYQLIEETLFILKEEQGNYFNLNYLTRSPQRNAEILSDLALHTGFREEQTNPVFPSMLSVKKGSILYADAGKELRSLLAINLLIANENPDHSFWKLGKKVPQFIIFLDELKKKRDQSSHAHSTDYSFSQIEPLFPRVLYLLSLLIEGFTFQYHKEVSFHTNPIQSEETNMDQKVFLLAENEIENEVGLLVREFSVIKELLIEVEFSKQKKNDRFIVHCSKVIEEILRLIAASVLNEKAISLINNDMKKNLKILKSKMDNLGFQFNLDKLPESFKNVSVPKIKKAFRKDNKAVLSARLFAIMFSLLEEETELLREMAWELPQFIMFSARISDERGHGNRVTLHEEEVNEISSDLLQMVKKLLPILKKHGIS
jgi:hypothetical protein